MESKMKKIYIHAILIIVFSALPYLNIFSNEFAYDDFDFFVRWEGVKSLSNIPSFFSGNLPTYHQHVYRPARSVLQAVVYGASSGAPMGFHVFSIIVQISSALLVYLIVKELVNERTALITSLIFSVIPAHTDSITFMTSSFDAAGAVIVLASLYLYLLYHKKKIYWLYFSSVALATLAFFTYEITLIIPALIILIDICILGNTFTELKQKIKTYTPYLAAGIIFFFIRSNIVGKTFTGTLSETVGLASRIFTMLKAYLAYLSLMIFGAPLSIYHPVEISRSLDTEVIFAILMLTSLIGAGIYFLKHEKKIYTLIIFWFFLSLLPVSNIFQATTFVKEGYLYLASFAWVLLLAILLEKYLYQNISKISAVAFLFALFILLWYGSLTIRRNTDWKNSITLYQSALALNSQYPGGYNGLAFLYRLEKNYELAKKYAQKAIELDSQYYVSYALLGEIAMEEKNFSDAVEYFNKTLELNQSYVTAYLNRGVSYFQLKNYDLAEADYLKAIEIYPQYALAQKNLGILYLQEKKYDFAIPYFEKVIEKEPDPETYFGLGVSFINTGRTTEGKKYLETALELRPNFPAAQNALKAIDKK